MAQAPERRAELAMQLRDRLRASGDNEGARVLDDLLRGYSTARVTLKVLHRDNMELRQRLGLPSFLDTGKAVE